jgi:hypothetical protein
MHEITSLVSRGSPCHWRGDEIGLRRYRIGAVAQRGWIAQAEHAAESNRVSAGVVYLVEETVHPQLMRGVAELTEGAGDVSGGDVLDAAGGLLIYQQVGVGGSRPPLSLLGALQQLCAFGLFEAYRRWWLVAPAADMACGVGEGDPLGFRRAVGSVRRGMRRGAAVKTRRGPWLSGLIVALIGAVWMVGQVLGGVASLVADWLSVDNISQGTALPAPSPSAPPNL